MRTNMQTGIDQPEFEPELEPLIYGKDWYSSSSWYSPYIYMYTV